MTITLPPDLEQSLQAEARKRGTTLEQLVVDDLRNRYTPPTSQAPPEGESLYDYLKDFIGTVDGPAEALSEDTGRQFGDIVEEKHRRISERFARERRNQP